jgi:hypothetical protein
MECYCEPFEGEYAEFSEERWGIAAKEHTCCECMDTIHVGDLHQTIVGKMEGEFFSDRTCAFCVDERARLGEVCPDMPPVIGELACWLVAEIRGELETA